MLFVSALSLRPDFWTNCCWIMPWYCRQPWSAINRRHAWPNERKHGLGGSGSKDQQAIDDSVSKAEYATDDSDVT
jgi:hypothetical protein